VSSAPARPARRIFQPIHGRGIRKLLWKRLRIPRAIVHPALAAAKAAKNPAQVRLRRRLAQELDPESLAAGGIEEAKGYRCVEPGELPGTAEVVSRCTQIYRDYRANEDAADAFSPRMLFCSSRHSRVIAYAAPFR
jgi:hypothetical protein